MRSHRQPIESALYDIITGFYQKYGVGKFGLNKAFVLQRMKNTVS